MRIAAEIYFILKMIELLFSKKEYEAEKSVRDFLPHIYSSGIEKNSKLCENFGALPKSANRDKINALICSYHLKTKSYIQACIIDKRVNLTIILISIPERQKL